MARQLVLASRSPRRSDLLGLMGVPFSVQPADIDESVRSDEQPMGYARRMAVGKATHVASQLSPGHHVLGVDTIVVLNQLILGKPVDREDGLRMLSLLADSTHQVITALCLASGELVQELQSVSEVTFAPIDDTTRECYWDTGEGADKAGCYAIQGYGATFVSHIRGSHSGIMGLPIYETEQLLKQAGIHTWIHRSTAAESDCHTQK